MGYYGLNEIEYRRNRTLLQPFTGEYYYRRLDYLTTIMKHCAALDENQYTEAVDCYDDWIID